MHLKGALKNGCTPNEIREALLLVALYCGIPAANEAHRAAIDVLAEENKIWPRPGYWGRFRTARMLVQPLSMHASSIGG